MWAIAIILAASVLALFASGVWFIAIPRRLSGRIGESGELRRFRSRAGDAAPDEETLAR